jgi:DNA-binding MarR family transcriptional regulator
VSPKKRSNALADPKVMLNDHEYAVMTEIADNEHITQRELSSKLGVSLGSVNILINKMAKEGLIKIEQVSSKQVLYMLTPAGMMAKAKKTVRYLKVHYRAIYETKEKIKVLFLELLDEYEMIYLFIDDEEILAIMNLAIEELHKEKTNIKRVTQESLATFSHERSEYCIFIYSDAEVVHRLPKGVAKFDLLTYI